MPLIDMPLEQLLRYEGRNPRPENFDQFWNDALKEMRALDAQVELVPADFQSHAAECFDLYFTGAGGARVHAKYLRPKNVTEPHPAVVVFHGYSASSGDWNGYLGWVSQGYAVAALDVRGQAGKSQDVGGTSGRTMSGHFIRGLDDALSGHPEKMLFRNVYLDCAQLAGIVMQMPEVDAERVAATGGSQGGALTLACAALEPRIKKAAAWYPFLCDFKRVWEMDLASGAYQEIKDYFRAFDPLHQREDEIWTSLGYIDIQHLAPRIQAETLMIVCMMDTICPPSTQYAAFNKISAPKKTLIYPDFGHEGAPGAGDSVFQFLSDL
jgi:cephalosporin-C deacetylase